MAGTVSSVYEVFSVKKHGRVIKWEHHNSEVTRLTKRAERAEDEFNELLALLAPGFSRIKPEFQDENGELDEEKLKAAGKFDFYGWHYPASGMSNREILDRLKAEKERERFDALKASEKVDYLFEKLNKEK